MTRLFSTVLIAVFASSVVAFPKHHKHHKHHYPTGTGHHHHHHHHHHSTGTGTGEHKHHKATGSYAWGNETTAGPTGTGTAPVIYSTVVLSPVPVSESAAPLPESSTPCGPPTVTVTGTRTHYVTASTDDGPDATPTTAYGNGTSVAPIGPTGISYPSGSAPWNSPRSSSVASSSSVAVSSSAAALPEPSSTLPYKQISLLHPTKWTSALVRVTPLSSSSSPATTSTSSTAPIVVVTPSSSAAAIAPIVTPTVSSKAAPVSASAAPSVPPTRAGGHNSNASQGRRGLIYNAAASCAPFASSGQISWAYNWSPTSAGLSGVEFVPMMWGADSDHINNWQANLATVKTASYVMSLNEPDETRNNGGCNLSPTDAANAYNKYVTPLHGGPQLALPAVTNAHVTSYPYMGLPWLDAFMVACSSLSGGCPGSVIPLHWYGWSGGSAAQQASVFQQYISDAQTHINNNPALAGKQIWVTEFSAVPTNDIQLNADFLKIILPWLDGGSSGVSRYSFFMASDGLLISGGSLSSSGQVYNSGL